MGQAMDEHQRVLVDYVTLTAPMAPPILRPFQCSLLPTT